MGCFRNRCPLFMNWFSFHIRHVVTFFALMVFIVGCSGITPIELRNEREEGPQKGLFSGSAGEFVIFSYTPPEAKPLKPEDAAEDRE